MVVPEKLSPTRNASSVPRVSPVAPRLPFTSVLLIHWLDCFYQAICSEEKRLTELDSAIGDGDHGVNMRRGMETVMQHRGEWMAADLRSQFRMVSGHLTATVGGASGPLYGAFFLHASCVITEQDGLRLGEFANCLEAGLQGVVGLGHAELGDKTMVDVLFPTVSAYKAMSRRHVSPKDIFSEGVRIAEVAMKATIPLQARKGRASYLGARSIGYQDPGGTSMFLLFRSLAEAAARDSSLSDTSKKTTTRKLIP